MIAYEDIRQQASQAIRETGALMTLQVVTGGGEVGPGGSPTATTTTDYAVHGVKRFYQEREIDGQLILQGDLQVILEAENGMPAPMPKRDKLIIDGETWDIENNNPLAPGPETILYKLQARK
ncbi:MAG: hypothetical protein ABIJ86_00290 [Spirochaetota bacterium]